MNKREHAFSKWLFYLVAALVVAACGSGGSSSLLSLQGVSSYQISATLGSGSIAPSGSTSVTVTLRDPTGTAVPGSTVNLSVSGPATLSATSGTTDAFGQVTVTLSGTGASSGSGSVTASYVDSSGSTARTGLAYSILNGNNVVLSASKTQLKSGAGDTAVLTAFVTDSTGAALANTPVQFSLSGSNSGSLSNASNGGSTDSSGRATITYSPDTTDRSNKTVTVSAQTTGGTSSTVATLNLSITGTSIQLSAQQSSVVLGTPVTLTATALDGNKAVIPGATVTLTAAPTANLPAGGVQLVTDSSGQVTTTATISSATAGQAVFTATGQGASGTLAINVSTTSFTLSAPASNSVLTIGVPQTVTVHWTNNNTGVSGQTVYFSSSLGSVSAPSAVTDASGNATVTLTSPSAGQAIITANTAGNALKTSATVTFTGTTPSQISVQAAKTNLNVNEQTIVTATVRDNNNNPVSGQVVQFNIVSDDSSGPGLSAATALTDTSGQASVTYTAGPLPGQTNGVDISASVQGTAVATQGTSSPTDAFMTVAGQSAFIALATGNTMTALDSTTYAEPHSLIVTDTTGAPMSNRTVTLSIIPLKYYKGLYIAQGNSWVANSSLGNPTTYVAPVPCDNEDVNHDAILQPSEDVNGNGKLDPGNPVTLSSGTVTTDSNGRATFSVIFGKDQGNWLRVRLKATTTVQGTESVASADYDLSVLAADVSNTSVAPPGGGNSPYGTATACTNPN
jgi:protocatechuate 3,4-dioxygenase beta subunit